MKNLILKKSYYFLTLLFLALISPVLMGGSDAFAQTGECTGGTSTASGTPECSTFTTEETCEPDTSIGCTWSGVVDADDVAFVGTICNLFKIVNGNGGKAFAAFAIISIGIGFFTGKVSWGLMIGVAAGIAALFGAPSIVSAISGEGEFECEGTFSTDD